MAEKCCPDCGEYLNAEKKCDCKQSTLAAKPTILIIGYGNHNSNLLKHLKDCVCEQAKPADVSKPSSFYFYGKKTVIDMDGNEHTAMDFNRI